MKFWVGVTDRNWFEYLTSISPDEVNFWRPSGLGLRAITMGEPFLFKLRKPENKICGGGFFIRSEKLPLSLAWDAFKEKNGASSIEKVRNLINSHRGTNEIDPNIGCIILNNPFFFPKEQWIDAPLNWPMNVPGKIYDTSFSEGKILWSEVLLRLMGENGDRKIAEPLSVYGEEYLIQQRLGQGTFKILVTSAYKRRCAISGEKALPVLQAAHIKPFNEQGPNSVNNGLLLRSDFHILFDRGYLTITPEYKIEVSKRIKEEFDNGKHYYAFHGNKLYALPRLVQDRPRLEYIQWHNENVYNV